MATKNSNAAKSAKIIKGTSKAKAAKDYGAPLREVGYEVRFDGRQKVAGLFKIKPQAAPAKAEKATTAPTVASKPQSVPAASKPKAKGKTAPKAAKAK